MNGRCFEDCYWYYEEKDMGARIPFCKLRKGIDPIGLADCENCENYHSKYKPTNADKIRAMSDFELAEFLVNIVSDAVMDFDVRSIKKTMETTLDWLRSEADE